MAHQLTGIYLIRNITNGKFYVGSAVDIKKRWSKHKWSLKKNHHENLHLQRAWNKYGDSSFVFETYLECSKENLRPIEQYLLDAFVGTEQCYNIAIDASVPARGLKHSAETIQKRSESLKGRLLSEEHKRKIGLSNRGNVFSEKARQNMSISHLGYVMSDSQKQKISASLQGINGPLTKLSESDVLEIRSRYIPYVVSLNLLAIEYSVDKKTILNIVQRKTWMHI